MDLFNRCHKQYSQLALLLALIITLTAHAQSLFRCEDANGNITFTDSARNCPSAQHAAELDLPSANIHSQFGEVVSEEYHNYRYRHYKALSGFSIPITVEQSLWDSNPTLAQKAAQKLERIINKAKHYFPASARAEISGIRYFIFLGDESSSGGRKGGQWYFRKGNHVSTRFDDAIIVRSADDYVNRYNDTQATRTAIHELSHAYYYYHRPTLYHPTKQAFNNANRQRLYYQAKTEGGKSIDKAYALTNQREYFAELAKTYFYNNYHYPFNQQELGEYDPVGHDLIQRAFFPAAQ